MPQEISFEEFQIELRRIGTDIINYCEYDKPIKQAVGLQCADYWMRCLQELIEDVKKDLKKSRT